MSKRIIYESVRGLVEFVLKTGSIDNRFTTSKRALEGTKAHQKLQKSNSELFKDYEKEVYLSYEFELDNFLLKIDGRADGIIIEDNNVTIEEIKSTYKPIFEIDDKNELHWAQAKVYSYIYIMQNNIDSINIQLSYYQLESNEVKSFRRNYEKKDLEEFIFDLIGKFEKYIIVAANNKEKRNASIKLLNFPFKEYRKGQLKLARAVYGTIRDKKILFAQAPTGIGKTISTIFPSIKSIGEGLKEKIFYLTAKNVNRVVAEEAYERLRENGLHFKTITITAKEKMCLNDKVSCNPEECPYAIDYYDKSKEVIFELLNTWEHLSKDRLIELGKNKKICPFELSLDMIEWCDGIICDYNYIFDPRVALKRIVEDMPHEMILLIDEGHNLVDRGREMYSASLNKEAIMSIRREIKGKLPNIYKALDNINSYFIKLRRECGEREEDKFYVKDEPKELYKGLRRFISECEDTLVKVKGQSFYDELLQLYFDINKFLSISELYSDEYVTKIEREGSNIDLKLYCIDPSKKIKSITDKVKGSIIFSATISPMDYYMEVLGGNNESYRIRLESPFNKENFKSIISPRNTRFSKRKETIGDIIDDIDEFIKNEEGNYLVFFPSYDYLDLALPLIDERFEEKEVIIQSRVMNEEEREDYLNKFNENKNVIGFAVLGGVFSEGIDLPGEKLIGCVVIGVGYPKISIEREIIKDYYERKGYDYAYTYPGINKVLQAVGRVIRTEKDKGRSLLIDDRYLSMKYKNLLPNDWIIEKKNN